MNNLMFTATQADLSKFLTDCYQRSVLFMDAMRIRGNDMVEMTTKQSANVLTFAIEKILDGKDFETPINYWLARVLPLPNIPTDFTKRPYVIQDPRAGRGPGIAGFKKESEIGSALQHGHPVYFIGYDAEPIGDQTYSDVIKGQVKLYQKVNDLHPSCPKLCAIGNCAAGYLTMFVAMIAPDLFGPILIAGSPISFWNGKRGGNPMRYGAGKIGGAWLTSFLGDIGGGRLDGTNLVMNFNMLDFDYFIWGKQYSLYANIDTETKRFLEFERWLSSFGELNREEILWIVQNLFINNMLTTGQLKTDDGISLDPRNINSPIITFISDGDTISPPGQSAAWIADLYHNVDEIIARGKTIVYCLNQKAGHLALFTGTKIAKRENMLFVENMDSIDLLPPGLYELILDTPEGKESCPGEELMARYVTRTIDDIKKLGCNSEEDDRAFATVAKASEAWLNTYNNFIHPLFKMYHQPSVSEFVKNMQPLRWSYWIFAEKYNPFMQIFAPLAENAKANRQPADQDNYFWQLQNQFADNIAKFLKSTQSIRDKFDEEMFFNLWGNPLVQRFWDTYGKLPRHIPSTTKLNTEKLIKELHNKIHKLIPLDNDLNALMRKILLAILIRNDIQQMKHGINVATVDFVIDWAKQNYPKYSEDKLREIIAHEVMASNFDQHSSIAEYVRYLTNHPKAEEIDNLANEVAIKIEKITASEMEKINKTIAIIGNEFSN